MAVVENFNVERIAKLEAQVESVKESVREMKDDIKELHSRITTGNREILDKIESMEARIEQRMDASAAAAKKQHDEIQIEIQKDIREMNNRVSSLEKWKWYVIGGVAVLGYVIGHIEWLGKLFN